jgi:small-conductance mechanosensitive channel
MQLPYFSQFKHFVFLRNSLEDWAVAIAVGLAATIAILTIRGFVLRRLAARSSAVSGLLDDFASAMLTRTYLLFILTFAIYLGSTFLQLSDKQDRFITRLGVAALLVQAAIWADTGLRAWRDRYRYGPNADSERRASSSVLCFFARLALWAVTVLMVLDNFAVNITTLVASLGIGGVAVALATQNILGDLFASLSIMLDKPFEIGDFIIVGDVLGSVEHIGLKTTRLRGLGGEQVVFSNGELLKSRIHNHKRMQTRRVAFVLRVAYGTSRRKSCAGSRHDPRDRHGAHDMSTFERAHFFLLRRLVAQLRGGLPLPSPGLRPPHGCPAGHFPGDLPQLPAGRHRFRPPDLGRAPEQENRHCRRWIFRSCDCQPACPSRLHRRSLRIASPHRR